MKSSLREFRMTFKSCVYILIALYILFAYFCLIELLALGFLALLEEKKELGKIKYWRPQLGGQSRRKGGKQRCEGLMEETDTNFYWGR